MEETGNFVTDIVSYLDKLSDQVFDNSEFITSLTQAINSTLEDISAVMNSVTGIVMENVERLDMLEMMIDTNRELINLQSDLLVTLSNTTLFSLGLGMFNAMAICVLASYVLRRK